jgi:hypothetical protein
MISVAIAFLAGFSVAVYALVGGSERLLLQGLSHGTMIRGPGGF